MDKDYKLWNRVKIGLNSIQKRPYFKSGQVWWYSLGENIGDEEDGKGKNFVRPVLIIRKFNNRICLALPLTKQIKNKIYYYKFEFKGIEQCAMLSQLRIIDSKRLHNIMGKISTKEFTKIKLAIAEIVLELRPALRGGPVVPIRQFVE